MARRLVNQTVIVPVEQNFIGFCEKCKQGWTERYKGMEQLGLLLDRLYAHPGRDGQRCQPYPVTTDRMGQASTSNTFVMILKPQ